MQKVIIFDFNRTLYDPETSSLFPDVVNVLTTLREKGFIFVLFGKGDGDRQNLVSELGIESFFSRIIIQPQKEPADMEKILANFEGAEFFVVGDRVHEEIRLGNMFHLSTIWFRSGKFAAEEPSDELEKPWKTISHLSELLEIV